MIQVFEIMAVFVVYRRILYYTSFESLGNPRCFPSLCGWQCEVGKYHCSGSCYHGTPEYPQGLLYPWHHNNEHPSLAGAWHVRGERKPWPSRAAHIAVLLTSTGFLLMGGLLYLLSGQLNSVTYKTMNNAQKTIVLLDVSKLGILENL